MTKKKTQKNGSAISIANLKELLKDNLTALWENDAALKTRHAEAPMLIPPVMVWGAPGVGKSTAVRELTKELGIGFIDVRLAQREPVDMRGLPVPENDRVKWLVSSEWPRDPESRGIIMFDELTAADKTLQVAAYEFILDRRLGELYQVPPGWYIMAAGNRVEDRAVSCAMSSALANRFLHVEVAPEADSFLDWATANALHPAVVNFIRYRPALLFSQEGEDLQRGWPSPRSWERVSTMVKIAEKNKHKTTLRYTIPGLVGAGAASEFLAFYKSMYFAEDKLGLRRRLLEGLPIPLMTTPDQLYACCGAIGYYIKMENDPKSFKPMCENFLKFGMNLPSDFAAMLMSDVIAGLEGTKHKEILMAHPLYRQWMEKHVGATCDEKEGELSLFGRK
ncbi:MAG: AAA family ATPase [Victivallaceae bacterium]|nr:AAA family ATPase [Victivallaceae bacterium]